MDESERLVEALQADILALRKKLGEKKQNATVKGLNLNTELGDPAHFSSRLHGAVFNLSAASGDGPKQRNNLLLQEAVRSLFASLPQFHTQTLTLEGFPVPSVCCGTEHNASTATGTVEHHGLCSLVIPSIAPLKRLTDLPMRESKRRKSSL